MYLYDIKTNRVVAAGISEKFSTLSFRLKTLCNMELKQGDSTCDGVITGKIVIKDNFARDWVSDILFAEKCSLSDEEWCRFNQAFNQHHADCFYDRVPLSYKLYEYEL